MDAIDCDIVFTVVEFHRVEREETYAIERDFQLNGWTYRAKIKSEGVLGRAYLEMWCRIPGRGEFFSKGLNQNITGTTDWTSNEIPFYLKVGQRPDLIKLNLVIEGKGKLWIKNVELLKTPLGS